MLLVKQAGAGGKADIGGLNRIADHVDVLRDVEGSREDRLRAAHRSHGAGLKRRIEIHIQVVCRRIVRTVINHHHLMGLAICQGHGQRGNLRVIRVGNQSRRRSGHNGVRSSAERDQATGAAEMDRRIGQGDIVIQSAALQGNVVIVLRTGNIGRIPVAGPLIVGVGIELKRHAVIDAPVAHASAATANDRRSALLSF